MKPLYAFAAVVPAGVLLGFAGGKASQPEMQFHQTRAWPQSVVEHGSRIEPYRPIYEAGPQDLSPRAFSYRPDLDYSFEAVPPQEAAAWPADAEPTPEYAATPVAADYSDGKVTVHVGSSIDLAASRAVEAANEAAEAVHAAALEKAAPRSAPIAQANPVAFQTVAPIETESF